MNSATSDPFHRQLGVVSELSRWQRTAFAAWCCECVFPDYATQFGSTHPVDVDCLRSAIDCAWSYAKGAAVREDRIHQKIAEIENVYCGADDDMSRRRDAAIEATGVVIHALETCVRESPDPAAEAAESARHTVYHSVLDELLGTEGAIPPGELAAINLKVFAHPRMINMVRQQETILVLISQLDELSQPIIDELRQSAIDCRDTTAL